MTPLKTFFIISGIIIILIITDIINKKKFSVIHVLLFLIIIGFILCIIFIPSFLFEFGNIVGVEKGSDFIVYTSIIFLTLVIFKLIQESIDLNENITSIIRSNAIHRSGKRKIKGNEVFLIPVYNEEPVIKNTINNILNEGYENILVVNDGSTDKTKKVLKEFGDKIFLINHYKNRGYGAASKTGFEYIKKYGDVKYVITFDADGQHSVKDAKKFLKTLEENEDIDIVLGSRFLKGSVSNVPFGKKIILFGGKVFTWIISGIFLTDSHNGYRAFKKEILYKTEFRIDTMAFSSEFIDQIKKQNLSYLEIPVNITYSEYSMKKGQKISNSIYIAFRTIWNKLFK